ncbi:hypothetical protein [uncultured Desulfovibrio sp.]|uniref:beta strand repeat-containing protein n=1 Tax=uncultured Desulfovibrio sp. TaxID=167968 RepID=UPI0026135134|nr:hypothetical protein [uncultured Desulfovibrio sp.]
MSAPAWFNYETYLVNKLAQLKTADPEQYGDYTEAELKASMLEAGYSNDADGMYQHFEQFGNAENVSPSPYFVVSEYLANKLTQLQTLDPEQYGSFTVTDVANSFAEAGLSAWDHYTLFGQAEGVSPSAIFDNNAYLEAKLEQLKTLDPAQYGEYTVEDVVNAFAAEGLNPIEHYMLFGINEDLSYSPVTPEPPVTDELTTARDVLTLDAGDSIIAGVASALSAEKTLNENDLIDGGEGNDTLRVTLDANFNGFTVTDDPNTTGGMTNVENVELTNNGSIARTFSAKGSEGVTTYTLHAGEAGTGAINLKDLAAAGITVNVDGLQKGTTDVQFATGALSGAEDSMTFGLNNVGAAAASATADPTYVGLKATTGLESVTINASGVNYADLSGLDAASVAVTGAGSLEASAVNAALTSLDASAATGSVSADLSAATMQTVKGGAGDDTFIVKGLAPTAVLEGGAGNDTLIISESGAATLQPTVSGFETIGIADNTGAITLSAKNAQDFTTLLLENTGAKVTVANLSGSTFTVESLGAEKGAATTNTAVIADAVDLTVNVNAGDDAEKAQTVTTNITAASASNAVINVGANVAAAGTFTFGAAQSVQLNVASNKVDDAEQTSFDGTITAAKAQSLEVKAEGALGSNAKFDVANAASVVLDAAQGGTAAIVAGKATDVRLTAGGDLSLIGSNLAAAQSVTVVQNDGALTGDIALTGLNSLNVSGDGAKSAVDFGNLGNQTNEYNLSVVASGLAAGFTAGTVDSKGDISLDFSAVSGDVQTGAITGGADVSLVASQLGDNTFGAITAAGSVDVQAIGLLGDQLTLGDITATGDNSNVSLVVDGTATVKGLENISATGSVNVDLSGYMGEAFDLTTIEGADVTYVGADLVANDLGTVTASSLNFTGGLEVDTVTLEGADNETSLTATLDTGTGTDVVTVNGVASTETITVSGDLGGDGERVTVSAHSGATSDMTINIGGLTGYATSAITGTNFSDTIIGGSGNDKITAGDVSFATTEDTLAVAGYATYSINFGVEGFAVGAKISIGSTESTTTVSTAITSVNELVTFINTTDASGLGAQWVAKEENGKLVLTEKAGQEGKLLIEGSSAPTIAASGTVGSSDASAVNDSVDYGHGLIPDGTLITAICDTLTGGSGADAFILSTTTATDDKAVGATTIITDFSAVDGDTLKIGSLGAGSDTAYVEDGATYNSLSALLTAADAALDVTVNYVAAMFNGDTYIVAGDDTGHSAIVQLQGVSLDQLDNDGSFIVNA